MLILGTDIVDVERFARILTYRGERFLSLVYTTREREAWGSKPEKLARVFAAKEATAKALGCGFAYLSDDGVDPREVEILPDRGAGIGVYLRGDAKECAHRMAVIRWMLTFGSARGCVLAIVVGTSDPKPTIFPRLSSP
jgi:holo-[acyl-carrier protein] synthase